MDSLTVLSKLTQVTFQSNSANSSLSEAIKPHVEVRALLEAVVIYEFLGDMKQSQCFKTTKRCRCRSNGHTCRNSHGIMNSKLSRLGKTILYHSFRNCGTI